MDKGSSIIFGVLLGATIISGIVLSSNSASADPASSSTSTTASVKISAACTLTRTGGGSYTANIANGNSDEINGSTISSICNDPNGYSLYAIGFSNDSMTNNNDKLISSVSNDYNIPTGTSTSGGTSNWAMRVNPTTGNNPTITNSFNNYHNIPTTYMQVATYDSITTTPSSTGASVNTKYQVYISGSQPAGSYTGKVKYTLVHPNNAPKPIEPVITNSGYISYNPNVSNVIDTMGDQSIKESDSSATLWASNFQRPGYGFIGWTDKYDWVLNANDDNGNGTGVNTGYHIYGPNATITFAAGQYSGSNPGLSLYAVWAPSAGFIQDYTCPDNINMPIGQVTALTDKRDNQTYAVAKLADSNCWMIENLRLNNTNSDNTLGTLAQGYGNSTDYGTFIGLANTESADFNGFTPANSLYYSGTQSGTASMDIGTLNSPSYRFPRYNNSNTMNPVSNFTNILSASYSYGNYYTWAAAKANTGVLDSSRYSETVNTSICPRGWILPYGDNNGNGIISGGFYFLGTQLNATSSNETNSIIWRSYPNNFINSGYYISSGTDNSRGKFGRYWTATSYGSDYSYILSLSNTSVHPGNSFSNSNRKYYGYSVRCLTGN